MKETIVSVEIVNQDIENTAKNVKISEEAMEVLKEMEKLLKGIIAVFYGWSTSKIKNFICDNKFL